MNFFYINKSSFEYFSTQQEYLKRSNDRDAQILMKNSETIDTCLEILFLFSKFSRTFIKAGCMEFLGK